MDEEGLETGWGFASAFGMTIGMFPVGCSPSTDDVVGTWTSDNGAELTFLPDGEVIQESIQIDCRETSVYSGAGPWDISGNSFAACHDRWVQCQAVGGIMCKIQEGGSLTATY